MNKKSSGILLLLSLVFAVAIVIVFSLQYHSDIGKLSALKNELTESTAAWKKINEDKLVIQKELKEEKNKLRDAELTISESEERIEELEKEISDLEKQIEILSK